MADAPASHPVAPPPVQPTEPVEWHLALRGVALTLALGVLFIAAATALAGRPGGLGAGIGVAVVTGTLLLSGGTLSLLAPFGPTALMAAALGGYVLKLCIYALLIVLLRDVEGIDGPSLALTGAVLMLVAVAWQARMALRNQRLFWVSAGRSDAVATSADVVYPSGRDKVSAEPASAATQVRVSAEPGSAATQDPTTRSSDSRSTERTPA